MVLKLKRMHNCKYPINIDKVAIEKSVYLTRFNIVKKVLNTLLVKKIYEIKPLCTILQKMSKEMLNVLMKLSTGHP